jgi:hypothetical protein
MRSVISFIIFGFVFGVGMNTAKADGLPEYSIKAAYLYNFALLTDWPPSKKTDRVNMCFYGQHGFGSTFDVLRKKSINNQPINLLDISKLAQVKDCHVLFLGEIDLKSQQELMRDIVGMPILVVTDNADIVSDMVNISIASEHGRLVFDINLDAAKQVGLNLSSKLLKLARKVNL